MKSTEWIWRAWRSPTSTYEPRSIVANVVTEFAAIVSRSVSVNIEVFFVAILNHLFWVSGGCFCAWRTKPVPPDNASTPHPALNLLYRWHAIRYSPSPHPPLCIAIGYRHSAHAYVHIVWLHRTKHGECQKTYYGPLQRYPVFYLQKTKFRYVDQKRMGWSTLHLSALRT